MNSNEFITEARRGSVILVDFQSDYAHVGGYDYAITNAIEYINNKHPQVTAFYNGAEVGMNDDEYSVMEHYVEMGLDPDLINNGTVKFVEKTYAFLRNWMDEGIDTSTIIKVVRYMLVNHINDSRLIDEEILIDLVGDEWSENMYDDGLYIPDIALDNLHSLSGSLMGGGGASECLAEIQILMNALNIKYKLVKGWMYG